MSEPSFSFTALQAQQSVNLPAPETLTASDGVTLSYRRYVPATPRAVLVFYHGGGAHNAAGYQHLGQGLCSQFNTAVYLPDVRGHGLSGGKRGDAPSPAQVWADISAFIQRARADWPGLPLILGGHSSGAGLILNYTSQPQRESVDRYVFLSPEFGFRANLARPAPAKPFAKANTFPFIVNALSGGKLLGHVRAVRFNYPPEILVTDKNLVAAYTVNMANAVTPTAPHQQFTRLDRSFGLWIGAADELIQPSMVLAFADLAIKVRDASTASAITGATHLSVLLEAHAAIGPWLAGLA